MPAVHVAVPPPPAMNPPRQQIWPFEQLDVPVQAVGGAPASLFRVPASLTPPPQVPLVGRKQRPGDTVVSQQ